METVQSNFVDIKFIEMSEGVRTLYLCFILDFALRYIFMFNQCVYCECSTRASGRVGAVYIQASEKTTLSEKQIERLCPTCFSTVPIQHKTTHSTVT